MRKTAITSSMIAVAALLAASATQAAGTEPGPYPKAQVAIGVYQGEKACKTAAYDKAIDALNQINAELAMIKQAGTPRGIDLRFEQYMVYFDLADTAKSKHCWDEAESLYRAVLAQYANMAYQHPQDRAQSSLDDLQKARAKAGGK